MTPSLTFTDFSLIYRPCDKEIQTLQPSDGVHGHTAETLLPSNERRSMPLSGRSLLNNIWVFLGISHRTFFIKNTMWIFDIL